MDIYDFVGEKFEGKVDKNGESYFYGHLKRVAHYAYDSDYLPYDIREKLYDIGLLHDIFEDTDTTEDELREVEGVTDEVIEIVKILTRRKDETYMQYIERVSINEIATTVKLCDLRDNMDIRRYRELDDSAFSLLKRYHKAYWFLKNAIDEEFN